MLNLSCTFTSALSEVCLSPHVALLCSYLILRVSVMLLRYFLYYFEMHTVTAVFTGITFVFTFHIRCIYIVSSLYFRIFSTSFLNVILSAELITLISMCVPFLLSLIMVPDRLSFDPPISEAVCL